MRHTRHIIGKALVPFVVLAALLGAEALPALADSGSRGSPGPRKKSGASRVSGDPRTALGAKIFTGEAFDTCRAPSASVMRSWYGTSPFGAAGVYIGGRARACTTQPHLDSGWVRSVTATGWKLIPIYVGSQSPCVKASSKRRFTMSHSGPVAKGAAEGRDAVRQAKRLGMGTRSAIYLDMEAYDNSATKCATTTLRFIQGWNRAVLEAKYIPGFYSSADSGIRHMEGARKAGRKWLPEMVWFARWKVPGSVYGEKALSPWGWRPHRRIHQYDGDVQRTYGGHRLHIDRNVMDAPVAVVR